MITALFTYDYGPERMQRIRELGYEILLAPEREITFTPQMASVEVLVCYAPFQRLDITRMPGLRWVQLSSIGIDQVPKAEAKAAGLIVTNNRGGYSVPIGEWIVHKLLEMCKQSRYFYRNQEQKVWQLSTEVLELSGKSVAFIGTGTIAHEAARRLAAFDVTLSGFNTDGRAAPHFHQCFPVARLQAEIHRFDAVVLAVPGTAETEGLMNRAVMEAMKDSAMLINISRGSVLDEEALMAQLNAGRFLGVALDVFEEEPLRSDSPLWSHERVLVTPHNCWVSERRNDRRFELIVENMKRYSQGLPLLNAVDLDRGY